MTINLRTVWVAIGLIVGTALIAGILNQVWKVLSPIGNGGVASIPLLSEHGVAGLLLAGGSLLYVLSKVYSAYTGW